MPAHDWPITEGDAPPTTRSGGKYDALWQELLLRLEVTSPHRWLHIACEDERATRLLYEALKKRNQKAGAPVTLRIRVKALTLYVARGPHWARRDADTLAHLPAHPADAPGANGKRGRRSRSSTSAIRRPPPVRA